MTCPHCKGDRQIPALVNRGGSCTWESIVCTTCGGAGEVDDDYPRRSEYARKDRIAHRTSIREMAGRLGVDVVLLSDFESLKLPRGQWDVVQAVIEANKRPGGESATVPA